MILSAAEALVAEALAEAGGGAFAAAASQLGSALDRGAGLSPQAVRTVILIHDGGGEESLWRPLQARLLGLAAEHDILWARLRLLDAGGMEKLSGPPLQIGRWTGKDAEATRIARERGDEDDYCRTLIVYDWHSVADIDALLDLAKGWRSEENRARALSVAAETLMYRHGAFDRACDLLEEQRALQERRGSIVEQAKSLVRLTMALLAAGRLKECFATRDRAREMVDRLGPGYLIQEHAGTTRGGDLYPEISMESNFAWYTEGRWRDVAEHWVKAIALEEPGGSPVHIVEAAMAAQAYARIGAFLEAAYYLDTLTEVLPRMKPRDWAFNGAVGRAAHAIWDMEARRYAHAYRAMALAMLAAGVGDWTNTSLEQTVARMAALLGDAAEAQDYFDRARRRLGGRADDPRIAILDFDAAIATRFCPGFAAGQRAMLLDRAAAGFAANGMAGWSDRVARERGRTVEPSAAGA